MTLLEIGGIAGIVAAIGAAISAVYARKELNNKKTVRMFDKFDKIEDDLAVQGNAIDTVAENLNRLEERFIAHDDRCRDLGERANERITKLEARR